MARLTSEAITGQLGINLIEKRTLQMGFRWEATSSIDVGIDGLIEICEPETGEATNRIVLVQSKAGTSYFRLEDEVGFTYYPKTKDISYWQRGSTPVIVVISRPQQDEVYWTRISKKHESSAIYDTGIWIDKEQQRFDGSAAKALVEIAELAERRLVEIVVDKPIWDQAKTQRDTLLAFIGSLEPDSAVRVVTIGHGSVRLVLDLSASHASKLIAAHKQERLSEFQVTSVRLIAVASLRDTLSAPIAVDASIAYLPTEEETAVEYAEQAATRNLSVALIRMPFEGDRDPLVDRLFSSNAAVVFVGREGTAPWSDNQRNSAFLGELVAKGVRLLPALAKGAPADTRIPNFWRALSVYDFRQRHSERELNRLSSAITGSRFPVELDLVLCIDTTGSMEPILDHVKNEVRILANRLQLLLAEDTLVGRLRVRVIEFRDVYDDPSDAFKFSEFYELPRENEFLQSTIDRMQSDKGGDNPENGLESIVFAIRSIWSQAEPTCRRMIIVFSDAGAHPLGGDERHESKSHYLVGMPTGLVEMESEWNNLCRVNVEETKLVLVAPMKEPWSTISGWRNVAHLELNVRAVRNIGVLSEAIIREVL